MNEKPVVVVDPEIMSGKPCFAGTRVPVRALLDYIKGGDTLDEFLEQYPTVSRNQAVGFLEQASESLLAIEATGAKDVFDMMRSEMELGGVLGSIFKSGNKKALSGIFSAMRIEAQAIIREWSAESKSRFNEIDSLADLLDLESKPSNKLQQAETELQKFAQIEAEEAEDATKKNQ